MKLTLQQLRLGLTVVFAAVNCTIGSTLVGAQSAKIVDSTARSVNQLPLLKLGMRGQAVSRLQTVLKRREFYSGRLTGYFDFHTQSSVIKAKRQYKLLPEDGVVDTATWQALRPPLFVLPNIGAPSDREAAATRDDYPRLDQHLTALVPPTNIRLTLPVDISNDVGRVAFQAFTSEGEFGVFSGDDEPLTTIAQLRTNTIPSATPAINTNGTVAFFTFGLQQGGGLGVYLGNGRQLTTITTNSSDFYSAINDLGIVAFRGDKGLSISNGNFITTINKSGVFYGSSSINNLPDIGAPGDREAAATHDQSNVFHGSSSINNLPNIGAPGDREAAATSTYISHMLYGSSSINNLPDIGAPGDRETAATHFTLTGAQLVKLLTELAAGREVVARADSASIPEPSSILGLLTFGAIGTGLALGSVLDLLKRDLEKANKG